MARVTVEDCIDKGGEPRFELNCFWRAIDTRMNLVRCADHHRSRQRQNRVVRPARDRRQRPSARKDLNEEFIHSLQKFVEVDEPEPSRCVGHHFPPTTIRSRSTACRKKAAAVSRAWCPPDKGRRTETRAQDRSRAALLAFSAPAGGRRALNTLAPGSAALSQPGRPSRVAPLAKNNRPLISFSLARQVRSEVPTRAMMRQYGARRSHW